MGLRRGRRPTSLPPPLVRRGRRLARRRQAVPPHVRPCPPAPAHPRRARRRRCRRGRRGRRARPALARPPRPARPRQPGQHVLHQLGGAGVPARAAPARLFSRRGARPGDVPRHARVRPRRVPAVRAGDRVLWRVQRGQGATRPGPPSRGLVGRRGRRRRRRRARRRGPARRARVFSGGAVRAGGVPAARTGGRGGERGGCGWRRADRSAPSPCPLLPRLPGAARHRPRQRRRLGRRARAAGGARAPGDAARRGRRRVGVRRCPALRRDLHALRLHLHRVRPVPGRVPGHRVRRAAAAAARAGGRGWWRRGGRARRGPCPSSSRRRDSGRL